MAIDLALTAGIFILAFMLGYICREIIVKSSEDRRIWTDKSLAESFRPVRPVETFPITTPLAASTYHYMGSDYIIYLNSPTTDAILKNLDRNSRL